MSGVDDVLRDRVVGVERAAPRPTRRVPIGRTGPRSPPTPAPPALPPIGDVDAGWQPDPWRAAATDRALAADFPPTLALRYAPNAILGCGTMAVVYRATDLRLRTVVAVKLFPAGLAADPGTCMRFLELARTAQQLDHPNVGHILDAGVAGGRPYLILELIDGHSLRTLLALRGRLPLHTVRDLAVQIADALDYAHCRGVFHTDLRPENVLLDRTGRAKVVDFRIGHSTPATGGLARQIAAQDAPYRAPEQVAEHAIGPRTDLYALAAILHEMLVGEPPPAAPRSPFPSTRRLFAAPPRLRGERPDLSWGLEHLIRQALAPDPGDRPASARAFHDALLVPPRHSDLAADITHTAWAFRSALRGACADAPPGLMVPTAAVTRPPRRARWPSPPLTLGLPIVGTLALLLALLGVFELLPPVPVPFQAVPAPEFPGRMLAEAELIARASGLDVVKTRPEPCDQHPRDYVLQQEPEPGTPLRPGSKVRLATCSGLRVPDLVGQRQEQVRVQLLQRGWTLADVRLTPSADVPPGTVLAQDPPPGLILPDRQPLILTLAQEPRSTTADP